MADINLLVTGPVSNSEQQRRALEMLVRKVNDIVQALNTSTDITDRIYTGVGTPEGYIQAAPGSLYLNTTGGVGLTLYVKQLSSGNTGWTAVA